MEDPTLHNFLTVGHSEGENLKDSQQKAAGRKELTLSVGAGWRVPSPRRGRPRRQSRGPAA